MTALVAGCATRSATEEYAASFGGACAPAHYSEFLNQHLRLSSLGVGTFPGAADDATDECYADIVSRALRSGINVLDTAAHYRYGRSAAAVGEGIARARASGVRREQVFVIAKGGFVILAGGVPGNLDAWFEREIVARGFGAREDRVGLHCLSPAHIAMQLESCRQALRLETLDAFLIDQPEVHIPAIGKEAMHRKLEKAFVVLERAVRDNRIRCYGISSFASFRVETDDPLFQSLPSLLGLAEKAARAAWHDERAKHHFKLIELPFNALMNEGYTRFSQATGHGNIASALQAAHQLGIYAVGSHGLMKGKLADADVDALAAAAGELSNPAQRALQYNRSTPGLGTSLAGISTPSHLDDLLAVAHTAPLAREAYVRLYRRA